MRKRLKISQKSSKRLEKSRILLKLNLPKMPEFISITMHEERGEVNPSYDTLYKLIKALKVKSSDILPF